MKKLFHAYGRFVGFRPFVAIGIVVAVTALAVYGFTLTTDQADEQDAFLPDGSELLAANAELAAAFPDSAALQVVQVVLRGDVLSPSGLADAYAATNAVADAGALAPHVVPARPPSSPGHIVAAVIGAADGIDAVGVDLAAVPQARIDAILSNDERSEELATTLQLLESLVARDEAGTVVGGIGAVTVNANGDPDGLAAVQVNLDAALAGVELAGLESARTLSQGVLAKDADDANASSTAVLMLLAFAVIAVLLVLFYRQVSDVVLSLGGLILTIVWALGFQGLLGPDGFGWIGAPSVMATMVPVMMIGLCVDYGIQGTSRYREAISTGEGASEAISDAVSSLMLPLGLAGTTTIISFLTNLFGDISGMADFGVVAGVGVFSGLFIFLTGVPAVRVLLDRRREAKGIELTTKPMDQAIPGAGPLVERIAAATVRNPTAILIGVGIITLIMGSLITQLETTFNSSDFQPDGTDSKDDLLFLDENLGGNSEPVTVFIQAELTNDRTVRNLLDFSAAIEDPNSRPAAVSSGVTQSFGVFFESLPADAIGQIAAITEDLENPLFVPPEVLEEVYEIARGADPEGFDAVARFDEPDKTILQFNALTGDSERTQALFDDVDGLWFGDNSEITPIANEIINLEVTNSLTNSQATSIMLTILAAVVVLLVFFWLTEFRPMLALLSTLPILLVLIWVLGTMVILGYSYNVITALITALSIGIGVDYTIHVTHRFLEEREKTGSVSEAMNATMHTTGGALIGSALTTALGFAVLIFSPIPPMGQFGLLTALTVIYSLIAAILVLPPMLVIWAAYHDWRHQHIANYEG